MTPERMKSQKSLSHLVYLCCTIVRAYLRRKIRNFTYLSTKQIIALKSQLQCCAAIGWKSVEGRNFRPTVARAYSDATERNQKFQAQVRTNQGQVLTRLQSELGVVIVRQQETYRKLIGNLLCTFSQQVLDKMGKTVFEVAFFFDKVHIF